MIDCGDRVLVGVLGDGAEDGVAHDHRRIGRVQDDDRLAALARRRWSRTPALVVLVNSSMLARVPGPADADDTDATISAYGTSTTRRHRVDHRDGGLPTAGDHVDVRRIEVLAQVRRRDHPGPDRGRGQVDGPDAGLGVARRGVAVHVGAGRLEHQVGLLVQAEQPVHALVAGLQPELAGPGQTLARPGRCRSSSAARATPNAAACTAGRC